MRTLFYDDSLDGLGSPSLFLAGPTARGVPRTPWRARALELLAQAGFAGDVLVPEFREPRDDSVERVFGKGTSPVPGMSVTSFNILTWETAGIERSQRVLFWMPFEVREQTDPRSLPGFTTRAEVGRELARAPGRVTLGMPKGAVSGGHIRFHAARAEVRVWLTLEDTVAAALAALR